MSLKDDFDDVIRADDLTKFNALLNDNPATETLPIVIDNISHSMILHGAITILQKTIKIPTVLEKIKTDSAFRKSMLHNAVRHDNSVAFLNLLLEQPEFVNDVMEDPVDVLKDATGSIFFADILQRVQELTPVTHFIDAFCESFWYIAMYSVGGKREACKRLLEFPSVFDYVDCEIYPGNPGSREFLNTEFMEYYFKRLQQRITEFNNADSTNRKCFDVSGSQEGQLGYFILRNLISTYAKREEIRQQVQQNNFTTRRTKLTQFWSLPFASATPANVHLERINLLLTLPSVRRKAANNNNELLRMASGFKHQDIVSILRDIDVVAAHCREFYIDPLNEAKNPIDFRAQYLEKYPDSETARNVREQEHKQASRNTLSLSGI